VKITNITNVLIVLMIIKHTFVTVIVMKLNINMNDRMFPDFR